MLKEVVSAHMGRMIYVRVDSPGPVCTDIICFVNVANGHVYRLVHILVRILL